MSTQGASTSSPPSSSTPRSRYDVFLSFNGEDTRKGFTGFLYDALEKKSICTFWDEKTLESGKFILPEIMKAIEESEFAIVIFSKNYAFSTWCLDELVHIVSCRKEKGLEVLPIFLDVDPSDVLEQRGTFAKAFDEHKKRAFSKESMEKVETWRATLREVATITGRDGRNGYDYKLVEDIVDEMNKKLSAKSPRINKNLIGIQSNVEKLISNIGCMVGIYGMGGMGKTTIARVVYEKYSDQFTSSFIADVRERSEKGGLHQLQEQFLVESLGALNTKIRDVHQGANLIKARLRRKKVLLVLDDVNDVKQLENLAGEHWFGPGSWIIITTRDKHVLDEHGVLNTYELNGLNNNDALELFYSKAFKNKQPKEDYTQHSQEFVNYAGGLPLALVTLGSFVIGKKLDLWPSALEHFKKSTHDKIFDALKISFDGLEGWWKEIFLDIACFFNGWSKFEVIRILENCDLNAKIGISVLLDKSLLTVTGDNEELGMHGLLQEMGKKIFCQQLCEERRQNRSSLYGDWLFFGELLHALEKNTIESLNALLEMLPKGPVHNHVRRVLNAVVGFGGGPAENGQANNEHETESTATATSSTSAAPVSIPSCGWHATASPSTSAARGCGLCATASPSTSAARGCGRCAIANPSSSVARGRGRCATTPPVVTNLDIPAPIPHASPQPEVPPPIPDASPQSEVLPLMVDASPQPEVPSPTPPSQPSFDL